MQKFKWLSLIMAVIFGVVSGSSNLLAQTTTTDTDVETVILKDSDGDGILDKDDPHPQVPEIYIVKDDNKNGIVDSFEKQ